MTINGASEIKGNTNLKTDVEQDFEGFVAMCLAYSFMHPARRGAGAKYPTGTSASLRLAIIAF